MTKSEIIEAMKARKREWFEMVANEYRVPLPEGRTAQELLGRCMEIDYWVEFIEADRAP